MNYAELHFKGKRISLLGAGVSNMPLCAMAAPYASEVTVRDRKSPEELGEAADRIRALGARLITGEDYLRGIDEDLVFRSPGIRPDLPELMRKLGEEKIDSILLEGGATLNWSALSSGVVNRVAAYISPKIFGGADAKSPVEGRGGMDFPRQHRPFSSDQGAYHLQPLGQC